jgi:phasin
MNETTTAQAKAANPIYDPFGMSKYQMAKMEVPAQFRQMSDQGVAQARDIYAKAKVASEEAADLLASAYASAAKGATDCNLKLIDFGRTNTRAAFDCVHELLGVKSPSEFIELSTALMRKQFDMISAQNKELYAFAQELAGDVTGPMKASMSKTFNKVA